MLCCCEWLAPPGCAPTLPLLPPGCPPQASDIAPLKYREGINITLFLLCGPGAGCLSHPAPCAVWVFFPSRPSLGSSLYSLPSPVPLSPVPLPVPPPSTYVFSPSLSIPCVLASSVGEEARCCLLVSEPAPGSHSCTCLGAGELAALARLEERRPSVLPELASR